MVVEGLVKGAGGWRRDLRANYPERPMPTHLTAPPSNIFLPDNLMKTPTACAIALLIAVAVPQPGIAQARAQYSDYEGMVRELKSIAKSHSDVVELESHGRSPGGHDIWSITLSAGQADEKPALLVVGGVHGADLAGSEISVRFIRDLADGYGVADSVTQLLHGSTIYVFPRLNPDAGEAYFRFPRYERRLNERAIDLDKDGYVDEDGFDDLNGDGFITAVRVADPLGEWMPDEEIPELLRKADAAAGQTGVYRLFTEGRDDDGDGAWNEDEPGGVDLDRNFTHNYAWFEAGSGPHQVSEAESRALADFAFAHPNIAAVFTFSPYDNLLHPPKKPGAKIEGKKPITDVLEQDVPYLATMSSKFREVTGYADSPEPPPAAGALSEWAYYAYGRWSFSVPAWWPPAPADPDSCAAADSAAADSSAAQDSTDVEAALADTAIAAAADTAAIDSAAAEAKSKSAEPDEEDPLADQRRLWSWLQASGQADAFVPWTRIEHPDFSGLEVEVGGFVPFTASTPPAASLDARAEHYGDFLIHLAESLPRVRLERVEVEPLHERLYRLRVAVTNDGVLATHTGVGSRSQWSPKVRVAVELDSSQRLASGRRLVLIERLDGSGGTKELTWLIEAEMGSTVTVTSGSPMTGSDAREVTLK